MKIKQTYETEAYITEGGYYAIKQPGHMGDDESLVLLSPDQMRAIMDDMKEALEVEQDWWAYITTEGEQ